MNSSRRSFLYKTGLLAGAFSSQNFFNQSHAATLEKAAEKILHLTPEAAAEDEDYWSVIQQAFTVNPNIINLNNGGVSPSPKVVQDAVERYNKFSNEAPSYFMWRILDQGREPLREKLADLRGVTQNEIAINRNATEALNTRYLWSGSEKR